MGQEATFERGSYPKRFALFPGANNGDDVPWVEDSDPVEIQGGYDKISGQLANVGGRNDRLMVSLRHAGLGNSFSLTTMRIFPSRIPSDGE